MDEAVRRVKNARNARGWSIRTAAQHGGISNQTWSVYERDGNLTDAVHRAVMQAFDWPATWRDDAPEAAVSLRDEVAALSQRLDDLAERLNRAAEQIAKQGAELAFTGV